MMVPDPARVLSAMVRAAKAAQSYVSTRIVGAPRPQASGRKAAEETEFKGAPHEFVPVRYDLVLERLRRGIQNGWGAQELLAEVESDIKRARAHLQRCEAAVSSARSPSDSKAALELADRAEVELRRLERTKQQLMQLAHAAQG